MFYYFQAWCCIEILLYSEIFQVPHKSLNSVSEIPPDKMLEEPANFKPLHIKQMLTMSSIVLHVLLTSPLKNTRSCNKVLLCKLHETSEWIFFFSSMNVRVSVSPEHLAIIVKKQKSCGLQSMQYAGNKPQLLILPTNTSLRT
jgi:hypothetical protein